MEWLVIIGLITIGITGLVYLFLSKRATNRIEELGSTIENLEKSYKIALSNYEQAVLNYRHTREKVEAEEEKLNELSEDIKEREEQLKRLDYVYNEILANKKENIKAEAEDFKKTTYEYILKEVEDCRTETEKKKKSLKEEYEKEKQNFENILQEYRSRQESIIKLNKEQEELKTNEKFYCLQLSLQDLNDIKILEEVKPSLHQPDILDKLIYKVYYEKPYTDLIGRVIGTKKITGIYKITNLKNNKIYIGQAVDIAERWRQHLKRALGAEPRTSNKLYPAMYEDGPYNFTWQIVEECSKETLTEKEKYWIDFYEGQGYGYNIKG